MKKFISLSLFVFIVIIALLAKSAAAQAQTNVVVRPVIVAKPVCKPNIRGHWRWNRRKHMHVWVEGRRAYSYRAHRMRAW